MTSALRNTGIEPVGEMPWATHFCQFYETTDDLLEILPGFFKAGLEASEFCTWVVSEPLTEDRAWQALNRAVPRLDRYVSDHSVEVLNARDVYLADGSIDRHRIIGDWNKKLQAALSRGFHGIRASGDIAWLKQTQWTDFMEYEAEVHRSVGAQRMLLLCTYPLTTSVANVFDVARTHQFAVAKRRGQWEVVETPELTHAKAEIVRLNRALEQRAALAHRVRLATISEVTAALAHRMSQPLTAIMANAATSVQRLEGPPPGIDDATEAMRRVIREAKRASAVISHARALAKTLDEEKRLVDIHDVIREVLSLLEPELSEHDVLVEAPLSDDGPLVLGERTKLQQAVLSLIMNAVEAMADVTTRPRRLVISCERGLSETGPDILVAVQDNGIGTTAHDLESLFDPFFTTKRDGLGMGLSIGRSVAQAHGGRLWARRNVDHGLTFYLLLPETSSRPV